MAFDFNPVEYGVLLQKVESYERRFDDMEKHMDKMQVSLEQLCEMANKSKGGFWVGMVFVSIASSIIGFFSNWLVNR